MGKFVDYANKKCSEKELKKIFDKRENEIKLERIKNPPLEFEKLRNKGMLKTTEVDPYDVNTISEFIGQGTEEEQNSKIIRVLTLVYLNYGELEIERVIEFIFGKYGIRKTVLQGLVKQIKNKEKIEQKKKVKQTPKTYVDNQISSVPPTTEEIELLQNPELLQIIDKEFDKKIVKEDDVRMAVFLNGCGKLVINSAIASFNLCMNSNSGAGKDFIVKNVLKIFPKSMVVIRSRISPTTFTYWHNSKFEPNWTWDNKICLLSDISNSILNHEVFKLMCSDGTHSTIVINQIAIDIQIKGKPVMFVTTASANPNNEMLRRFPIADLNESINQTKAIKKRQAIAATNGIVLDYNPLITKALEKLKRVKVKIPFAETLTDFFPDDHIIMRTHFQRLLDYIKASAALFQYQRKIDEEGFVIAQTQDYDNATISLKVTTSNPRMIPLSKKQKMLLEQCKKLNDFSVKELEPHIPFLVQSKIYDYLAKLQDFGFLKSHIVEIGDKKKPIRYYTFVDFKIDSIPKWDDICRIKGNRKVRGIEVIKVIEGKGTPIPYHSPNSPPNLRQEKKSSYQKCSICGGHIADRENEAGEPICEYCQESVQK